TWPRILTVRPTANEATSASESILPPDPRPTQNGHGGDRSSERQWAVRPIGNARRGRHYGMRLSRSPAGGQRTRGEHGVDIEDIGAARSSTMAQRGETRRSGGAGDVRPAGEGTTRVFRVRRATLTSLGIHAG